MNMIKKPYMNCNCGIFEDKIVWMNVKYRNRFENVFVIDV